MGLSSSQGRLLMLTSKLSDIELGETLVAQRQNQLAMQQEGVAKTYNEAMSNYKIVIKVDDTTESKGYRLEDINYNNMTKMGYLLTNREGQIYLKKDSEGNWEIPQTLEGTDILKIDEETGKAAPAPGPGENPAGY